jgi:hypothetical protein
MDSPDYVTLTWGPCACSCISSATQYASGVLPFIRQMAAYAPHAGFAAWLPERWSRLWKGKLSQEVRQLDLEDRSAGAQVSSAVADADWGSEDEEDAITDPDGDDVIDLT